MPGKPIGDRAMTAAERQRRRRARLRRERPSAADIATRTIAALRQRIDELERAASPSDGLQPTAALFETHRARLGNGISHDDVERLLQQCDDANAAAFKALKQRLAVPETARRLRLQRSARLFRNFRSALERGQHPDEMAMLLGACDEANAREFTAVRRRFDTAARQAGVRGGSN